MKRMRNLSRSLEDYLEAILVLENKGGPIHSIKIAQHLNVSKPAVTRALKRLANLGYIYKTSYSDAIFTKKGRDFAKDIYHRHTIIKKFLISIGVNEKTAEIDCCKIEHVISNQTLKALTNIVNKSK